MKWIFPFFILFLLPNEMPYFVGIQGNCYFLLTFPTSFHIVFIICVDRNESECISLFDSFCQTTLQVTHSKTYQNVYWNKLKSTSIYVLPMKFHIWRNFAEFIGVWKHFFLKNSALSLIQLLHSYLFHAIFILFHSIVSSSSLFLSLSLSLWLLLSLSLSVFSLLYALILYLSNSFLQIFPQ